MALTDITPVASWDTPKTVTAGDDATASDMLLCLQPAANREQWLRSRIEEAASSSAADAIAALDGPTTGDTNWHESAVVLKSIGGVVGQVVNLLVLVSVVPSTVADQSVDLRLKMVDNGVTSYLCAQRVSANGAAHRVMLAAKHTLASVLAALTLEYKNSNAAVSTSLLGGWTILTW